MIPHKPFIHSLLLLKTSRTVGWISPAEVGNSAPQDVGFAAPVDPKGQFNDAYSFEVFKYDRNSKLISTHKYEVRSTETDGLQLDIEGQGLIFREKRRNSRQRSFPYLGRFKNPDFLYRLVEVEPEPSDLLDTLFLSDGLVLIGCAPSSHYQGWIDPGGRSPQGGEKMDLGKYEVQR